MISRLICSLVNDSPTSRRALLGATASALVMATTGCSAVSRGGPTVAVGPGDRLRFRPETVSVPVGTTVSWRWRSNDHNLVPSGAPEGASWDGTPGDEAVTYGQGYRYETTFPVAGTYGYYCQPHLSAGMTGAVVVE